MDVLAFPPEVLALALSQTDAESVHSLMCASRATCQFVRSFRDQIHLENRLQKFIDSLPCITGSQNLCHEENVCVFNNSVTDNTHNTTQHALYGKGSLIFRENNVQYISIRCPVQAKYIRLSVGGQQILAFDETLMHLFDVDDGYVDIMSFMKNLPGLAYHDIRIDYDTCDEHMAMFTTTGSFALNLRDRISWQVIQLDLVCENSIQLTSTCLCQLHSNHISLGHIIAIQQDARLVTDLVKTFTVKIDTTEHQVPAAATRTDLIAHRLFNGPINLQKCYYLQLSEKVNCSKVDNLCLQIDFIKPVTATIKVYNLHTNYARTLSGMLGLAFAA